MFKIRNKEYQNNPYILIHVSDFRYEFKFSCISFSNVHFYVNSFLYPIQYTSKNGKSKLSK